MSVEKGVLTQEQIDTLVSAISTGQIKPQQSEGTDKKELRVYDFRSPEKLTKESFRSLSLVYDNFTRITGNALSVHVRTNVDINTAKTDQIAFGELMFGETDTKTAKPKPGIIVLFSLPPLQGSGILQIDLPLAFTIIDRMLGGPGWATQKMRPLTPLEQEIIHVVVSKILESFKNAWKKYKEFEYKVLVLESDPRMVPRVIPFHDIMVRSIFGTKLGDTFGLIRLALPYIMLNPLLNLVESEEGGSNPRFKQNRTNEEIIEWIGRIRLAMTAELGSTMLTAKDVIELAPGDVLPLEGKIAHPINIKVGDKTKFGGQPGLVGERKAVQIMNIFHEVPENG